MFSKEMQQLDNSIRFVGMANNLGRLIATAYIQKWLNFFNG